MDVAAIPDLYKSTYATAKRGRSRRAAIRAHCLMCVGWNSAEVRLCTAPDCPLYPYRLGGMEGRDWEGKGAQPSDNRQALSVGRTQ